MKKAHVEWNLAGGRGTTPAGEPVYWTGDHVTGTVTLRPESTLNCRGVDLQLCLQAGGKCSPELIVHHNERLWEGPLAPGQSVERRFDLPLPSGGPVTYQGQLFHLDWVVRLKVDIPLWKDPVDLRRFIVRPRRSA